MRDYLMLASIVSRSSSIANKDRAGFVTKANDILGGNFLIVGQVGQVRLNDRYIGGDDKGWEGWDDLVDNSPRRHDGLDDDDAQYHSSKDE
jgi:hypothetical protein